MFQPRLAFQLMLILLTILLCSCAPAEITRTPIPGGTADAATSTPVPAGTDLPPASASPLSSSTASPTAHPPTANPAVPSLKARVTADRLSCRYGPGPEYLYLYGLRKDANIVLIGRTDGNNWVWVEGRNRCWLNPKFIHIEGDPASLPITYPEPARLPRSPYYPPTTVTSAIRNGNLVTVDWIDIPLRAGDEEDESMLHYIVETWRCENGKLIFDPLATNDTAITFVDESGCSQPSHGRVFVQEKHGFAGPAEIPWP